MYKIRVHTTERDLLTSFFQHHSITDYYASYEENAARPHYQGFFAGSPYQVKNDTTNIVPIKYRNHLKKYFPTIPPADYAIGILLDGDNASNSQNNYLNYICKENSKPRNENISMNSLVFKEKYTDRYINYHKKQKEFQAELKKKKKTKTNKFIIEALLEQEYPSFDKLPHKIHKHEEFNQLMNKFTEREYTWIDEQEVKYILVTKFHELEKTFPFNAKQIVIQWLFHKNYYPEIALKLLKW